MPSRLSELVRLFLKLGTIGFGGPAVHLATMEDEVVQRRGWLTGEQFVDLIGATNVIPGPNSTEMAMHIGYLRAGLRGLFVAGASFILPAMLITSAFAWAYVEFGTQPQFQPIMSGIKPAVLAIVFTAGWRLGRSAIKNVAAGLLAAGVGVSSVIGAREVPALLVAAVLGTIWFRWRTGSSRDANAAVIGSGLASIGFGRRALAAAPAVAVLANQTAPVSLWKLAFFFLKVGAVLYGSGYVLIAYLQGELVDQNAWLTQDQLDGAIAIGQFTPGPILSTATFIGYLLMAESGPATGFLGAAVASMAIFAPSFVLVAVTGPVIPKLRNSRWTSSFLDAVNAASMGLMAAVVLKMAGRSLLILGERPAANWPGIMIAAISATCILRWKVAPAWIVLGGAAAGFLIWMSGV